MAITAAKIAFQLSLIVMILGYGLTAKFADVLYVLKRPGLLARSLLSVVVIAPAIAVLLVQTMDLRAEVAIALVALAISPLPPLLPRRGEKARGLTQYGLGLVIVLAIIAVPVIVFATAVLEKVFGRDLVATPWSIGRLMAASVLAPLIAGMTISTLRPKTAARWARPIEQTQRWLLPIAMVVLLIASAADIWNLEGQSTLPAVFLFVVSTFAIGHLLGGPDRRVRSILAFASSCRHPATALAVASANFPIMDERGAVALYGLVTASVGLLYTIWVRRRAGVEPVV